MKPEQQTAAPQFKSVKEIENNAKNRMDKVISDLQHEMTLIRTGRASVNLLDGVKIDYYGTPTPINQVGTLHVPEPFMITIQPWDTSQIGLIEKAIRNSDSSQPRRSAGGDDETTRQETQLGIRTPVVSPDPTKTAAPWRTSQRAERAIEYSAIRAERGLPSGAIKLS